MGWDGLGRESGGWEGGGQGVHVPISPEQAAGHLQLEERSLHAQSLPEGPSAGQMPDLSLCLAAVPHQA